MYNTKVLDHFQNPRNLAEMKESSAQGTAINPVCGDVMTIFLKLEGKKISKATFSTMGCGAAIASGSYLTELLKGKTVEEAERITPSQLADALGGLPKIKHHCPELAIEALQKALHIQK